jgi:CRP-like cAMP-binding protein
MSAGPLQKLVDRLLLRSVLSDEEQQAVLSLPCLEMDLSAKRDLIAIGDRTEASYFVQTGLIGRFSQGRDGVRQIVALHIPGEMADLCLVALPKTSWAFHVLSPSTVLKISHADLAAIGDRYPGIALAFWRDCVADMAVMSEWIFGIARRPAEAKLAHLLCELRCRYKQAGLLTTDDSFTFPVTQMQIAEVLGVTSVHANRTIRSLRERGFAIITGTLVRLLDVPGLIRLADFDASYLHLDERKVSTVA